MSRLSPGWIRSRTPLRRNFAAHPLAATPIAQVVDHGAFGPAIFDQMNVGSCWGHAASRGIYQALAIIGKPLSFVPSPDTLYRIARALMRAAGESSGPLTDSGTDPFYGAQAFSQFGVKPMGALIQGRNTDCALEHVADEPNMAEIVQGAHALIVGAHQITTTGAQRTADVRTALSAGLPVIIGVNADAAIEDWQAGNAPLGPPDPNKILGGHMLCLDGYDLTRTGEPFLVANSWAADYGEAGRLWALPGWVEDAGAGDFYVLSVTSEAA